MCHEPEAHPAAWARGPPLRAWKSNISFRKAGGFVASDPKRVKQALQHIQRIKAGDYPVVIGTADDYRIIDRPWKDLAEPSKLAILQDAVDWTGVTNQDQSMILLSQIDPGKITDAQRTRLIDMALTQDSYEEMLREAASRGGMERNEDIGIER